MFRRYSLIQRTISSTFLSTFRKTPSCSYCKQSSSMEIQETKLLTHLVNRIKATGPITIAEYMKEVLTNSHSGYYMHHDVFGTSGDFITSPEISQMFGELIAVWFFNEWSRLGNPTPAQFVEFGPGRGTLMDDVLRTFSKLNGDRLPLVHLVEVSPHLRQIQQSKLSKYGDWITWHEDLETIPKNFSLFLAHEFFDALPVHKFQKTADGWREVLIDFDCNSQEEHLKFVLSRGPTPASKVFINPLEKRDALEVSPQSLLLVENISVRLESDGGIALIADYGYMRAEKSDTFRAFREHKLHDPLIEPGIADLTADVDFLRLVKQAEELVVTVGPVTQSVFLKNMGIDKRLQKLLKTAEEKDKASLISGHEMLTSEDQMGRRYKFLALYPMVLNQFLTRNPPPGFW